MANGGIVLPDAGFYFIYLLPHEARDPVRVVRAKSLERLVIVAYLFLLIAKCLLLVHLAKESGTIELYVAFDAVDIESEDY